MATQTHCARLRRRAAAPWSLALAVLIAAAPPVMAASKIPATDTQGAGETAGCTKVEGFVVDGADGLVVTSADCKGASRAWLSLPPPVRVMATTDASLVLDRLDAGRISSGQLFSSGPYCSIGGKELQWVAVYDWRKRKKIGFRDGGIRQAWIVDPATRRFVPAPKRLLERASCHASANE